MRQVNARVMECGLPRKAVYMGTHISKTKHYVEIRYSQRQSRKWMPVEKVTLHEGVELIYIEKVGELRGKEVRGVPEGGSGRGHGQGATLER